MEFFIDLGVFNSVFAVPTCVVDEHIKLAGSVQLKVLLWILRHSQEKLSQEEIAKALSMHITEIKDAMLYWIETGVLLEKDAYNKEIKSDNLKLSKELKKISKKRPMSRTQKPDSTYVAKRIKEDEKIAFLMQEAQIILGRTISNSDSALLLMLNENDGLPVDVIAMLLQYAVDVGKSNMKYIEKTAISWSVDGIDTVDKADNKIRQLYKLQNAWKVLQRVIGVDRRSPTPKEEEAADRWINKWKLKEELLQEAYNRCVDAKGRYILGYMNTILERFKNEGIDSVSQIDKSKLDMNKSYKKPRQTSYNIDKYRSFSIFD
ncbi:MAG: DnaD domain protein [Oscillospiraceae bacterium]|nr:DnaD domain protein [Oscillospiraceae bacterium]